MTTKTKGRPRGAVLTPQTPADSPVTPALARELQRVAKALSGLASGILKPAGADPEPEPERVAAAPAEPVRVDLSSFTKKERQVLAMHKRGKTNPEIAAETGMRDRDVSAVVRRAGLHAHRRPLPPMTAKEAQEIQRLAKTGMDVQAIARQTGRPEGTCFLLLHGHHRLSTAAAKKAALEKKNAQE